MVQKVMVLEILENVEISSERQDDLNGNFLGKKKKKSLNEKKELRNIGKLEFMRDGSHLAFDVD